MVNGEGPVLRILVELTKYSLAIRWPAKEVSHFFLYPFLRKDNFWIKLGVSPLPVKSLQLVDTESFQKLAIMRVNLLKE